MNARVASVPRTCGVLALVHGWLVVQSTTRSSRLLSIQKGAMDVGEHCLSRSMDRCPLLASSFACRLYSTASVLVMCT